MQDMDVITFLVVAFLYINVFSFCRTGLCNSVQPHIGGHSYVITSRKGKVVLYDYAFQDWTNETSIVWQYDIESELGKQSCLNGQVTEAKWAAKGRVILMTTESGIAILAFPKKTLLFYSCPGHSPHSIALLPDGNLVYAAFSGFLALYSTRNRKQIFHLFPKQTIDLPTAHGVQWDEKGQLLWAFGRDAAAYGNASSIKQGSVMLSACSYDTVLERLSVVANFLAPTSHADLSPEWPDWYEGGHDLTRVPGKRKLLMTTDLKIMVFDIASGMFSPPETIPQAAWVKSLQIGSTGQAIGLLASNPTTHFSDTINFFNPAAVRKIPVKDMYKARWFEETPAWPSFIDKDNRFV